MKSGRIVTLIGADGAGKSSQAERLCVEAGPPSVRIYMGSNPAALTHALPSTRAWTWLKRSLGRTVRQEGGPPRLHPSPRPSRPIARALQNLKSIAMLGLRTSEDLYRLTLAKAYARRGYLVVVDRHPYPDYYARRVRGRRRRRPEEWIRWGDRLHGFLLERVYPRPSGLILLDAPAEVLHTRKPEGSLAALRARRQEYLDMVDTLPVGDVTLIDATRGEDAVLADLLRIVRSPGVE